MIKQIVKEMRDFAFRHPYNPEVEWPISEDYARNIEYNGHKLNLVFSFNSFGGVSFWQLSISKMPLPKELLDEIARNFFPTGDLIEIPLGPTYQYAQLYQAENN
jgi:hypothetical protein